MIEFGKNERVDWFEIFKQLKDRGLGVREVSRMIDIPHSTLMEYKSENCRPKLEEGLKIIALWALKTGSLYTRVPKYNPFTRDAQRAQETAIGVH